MQNAKTNLIHMPGRESGFANLKKPVDRSLVRQREGWRDRNGNVHTVDYLEWHTVADILDAETPNWSQTVKDIRVIGDMVCVTVALTIEGVTREGIGTGTAESEMGIKKAEHDALKRAAVKFGVGRELYRKESDFIEREGAASGFGSAKPANPVARSQSDLVTAKQLGMIRAIARESGVDADEECKKELDCRTDEMSKRAASYFIGHLQELSQTPQNAETQQKIFDSGPGFTWTGEELKKINAWRSEMESALKEVGINPTNWLAKFDSSCPTIEKKEYAYQETMKAVAANRRAQLKTALANQGWEPEEVDREFQKYGIAGVLDSASDEQVNRMWTDYRKSKML